MFDSVVTVWIFDMTLPRPARLIVQAEAGILPRWPLSDPGKVEPVCALSYPPNRLLGLTALILSGAILCSNMPLLCNQPRSEFCRKPLPFKLVNDVARTTLPNRRAFCYLTSHVTMSPLLFLLYSLILSYFARLVFVTTRRCHLPPALP